MVILYFLANDFLSATLSVPYLGKATKWSDTLKVSLEKCSEIFMLQKNSSILLLLVWSNVQIYYMHFIIHKIRFDGYEMEWKSINNAQS